MVALVIGIVLMIWFKPRRTPAMNGLDCYISVVQICILAFGGMTVYGTVLQGELSTILMIMVVTLFAAGALFVMRSAAQIVFKTRQFDVFLSHHSGPGGAAARVMC